MTEDDDRVAVGEDSTEVVQSPSLGAANDRIERALDDGALVTISGRCAVEYDGRASSELDAGDRLLLLKPDGTALVHAGEGHQPVNWQPPGGVHAVTVESGSLVIESTRETPRERLSVRFDRVHLVATMTAEREGDLRLVGTEADLKSRILDDPDLLEPGFTPLATERTTPAGAIDVFGEDRDGNSVVVELKRRRVGPDAVGQLRRYVHAMRAELHAEATVRAILVAPSVTERAERLLEDHGHEFVSLEPEGSR